MCCKVSACFARVKLPTTGRFPAVSVLLLMKMRRQRQTKSKDSKEVRTLWHGGIIWGAYHVDFRITSANWVQITLLPLLLFTAMVSLPPVWCPQAICSNVSCRCLPIMEVLHGFLWSMNWRVTAASRHIPSALVTCLRVLVVLLTQKFLFESEAEATPNYIAWS